MGRVARWFGFEASPSNPVIASRTINFSSETPRPIDLLIKDMLGAGAVPRAGRDEALSVPAVLRGRNLICSISTLPLVTLAQDRTKVRTPLLDQIDPNTPNLTTLAMTVEDLLFESIAWWRVTARHADGFPASGVHVDAGLVSLEPPGQPLQTLPSGVRLPGGTVWVDGKPVPGRDMIRFDSPNPALLKYAGRTIRRAILLENLASMFAENPQAKEFFTPTEGADPVTDEEIEEILTKYRAARQKGSTAYIPAALKYNAIDTMSPAELQLVELQKRVTVDLANAMGLDSEDLQVSTTSRTYQNAVDRRRDRINDVLSPYMLAVTSRLSMNDVTRRGHKVAFDLDDYLKADPTTRWNTYDIALRNNVLSVEEIREKEEEPAVPVERAPKPRVPEQAEQESDMPAARFSSADSSATVSFEMDEATAAFRVNREKRTISGLLVPWGQVGRSAGVDWRFQKDSLRWADESRIKLNVNHDRTQTVAVATRLQNTPTGLDGSFRVARGPEGDRVLSFAEDGVLDGFSIEIDITDSDKVSFDNAGVADVSRGTLRHVAITASPAFDDARVTSVAASREGKEMTTENTETAPAELPDVAKFTSAVESFTAAVEKLNIPEQRKPEEAPAVVDPTTKPVAKFAVNEAPIYRFDGIKGEHEFSADLYASATGDGAAAKRLEDFMSAQFAVTTGNVTDLNPTRQRPDMYVDALDYTRPLWNSINKGTLADGVPFRLPKFNDASGLVADHTEGVEPTPGAFTATGQTITPTAVSGKVEINREAWDSGGNPQLSSTLWTQIVRAYNEALESAAAALLNGLTVTEITLTAGAVDSALASEVKRAMAALHFVRGGMRFRDLKIAEDLYVNLADAKDSSGRPIFPVLGAQNADGTTGALFGSLNIAGLAGMPAWALPQTVFGTPNTAGKSYLYNREDVGGWATAPQRLTFEYQVKSIEIGVFGYKALASTRDAGVRRVNYDDGRTS